MFIKWGKYMYHQVYHSKNSTFCPHIVCVCVCFVWISEETAFISLCNLNWLVFITELKCVYCAVRIEFLHFTELNVLDIYLILIRNVDKVL